MKKGKLKTKGQMQISFGMIFSIILIILFITFAVYGIKKFMEVTDLAKVEKFKSDFQGDINNMWKSTQGSQEVEYFIPKKISEVCFKDGEFENMYFVPSDYEGKILKNIDIEETVKDSKSNPKKICIETSGGKISLIIKKEYGGSNLVTIGGDIVEEVKKSSPPGNNEDTPPIDNVFNCDGTWKQEYYEEGIYECDGSVNGCDVNSCLCEEGFSPDSFGGCTLDDTEDPYPDETPPTTETTTTVTFSRSSIAAKANMESTLMLTATSVDGSNIDLFFEDVSDIGFEFTGNPGSFEDVTSGRTLLQTAIVPEEAYPGKYKIRAGAIPSSMVYNIKSQNGGTIPPLSTFPQLGFETDEILLDVNGINYAPVIELLAEQDDNTEGTIANPFHSGEVLLRLSIVSDEGFIGSYMPRWGITKVSGSYCYINPYGNYQLFGGNGLGAQLIVSPVSTRVGIRVTGIIEDGIHSVTTIRTIYVDPSPSGC